MTKPSMMLAACALAAGCGPAEVQQAALPPPPAIERCVELVGLSLDGGVVEAADPVAAGAVVTPDPGKPGLPAEAGFCRVQMRLTPVAGSSIRAELWLPERAAWNGKLLGAGNGGFGSNLTIPSLVMRGAVGDGYAAIGTDMGHAAESDVDASWAEGHPERVADYGWRANHAGVVAAKRVVAAYYRDPLAASYFHGCSDGGREALIEAQRFPEDYDAIIAGAPASPWSRLAPAMAMNAIAVSRPRAAIPQAKLQLLQDAALAQCDAADGVTDGVIGDPRRCDFDPGVLQCTAGDGDDCLIAPQLAAVRALYDGPRDAQGRRFFPGFAPGAEAVGGTWNLWLTGPEAQHGRFATQYFRHLIHDDPSWMLDDFDLVRDHAAARERRPELDADSTDLSAFFARGGKLLMYHGWADAAIPPGSTIEYYAALQRDQRRAGAQARLFLAPGMSHCLMGPGPNVFDALGTLDRWAEGGAAPERIVATKFDNDLFGYLGLPATPQRTRPLCAWPKVARYTGSGSTDDAANFVCAGPQVP